ncbi:DUF6020 family protein [Clostridium swellfunianum]|uniref:DUF6020 family protein n=1 Tax=Clostridium swellfunianum TaxID=1367462 RepID=UPI00202E6510|nr:DUF6020 family protein [Clostridium swellfunianum]MCM0647695.1 DUF6020 family protein [Clostridium swellfunianum]
MRDKRGLQALVFGAVLMIICFLLYLAAYFPALMSTDSLDQWSQMVSLKFNDWHPAVHTWLNLILTKVWYSPASIALAQIIALVFVYAYAMYTLLKLGVGKAICFLTMMIFALYPINGFLVITLWKDIPYSIMLLWITINLMNIVKTEGEWVSTPVNAVSFTISCLGAVFFRHNGMLVFLIVMVVLFIIYRNYKRIFSLISVIILASYFIITGPVFNKMNIAKSPSTEALGIPMQQLAAVVRENGKLDEKDKEFLSKILPLELWNKEYLPYSTNPIKFSKDFNGDYVSKNKSDFVKHWAAIVMKNPQIAVEAYLKQTSIIWKVKPYADSYTYTVTREINKNQFGLQTKPINSKLNNLANKIYEFTYGSKYFILFWRPALWLYLSIISALISAVILGRKTWVILMPLAGNILSLLVAIPAQDYRYLYSNVLIAAVLIPLAVNVIFRGKTVPKRHVNQ